MDHTTALHIQVTREPTVQTFLHEYLSIMSTKGGMTNVHEWATVQITS